MFTKISSCMNMNSFPITPVTFTQLHSNQLIELTRALF